MYDKHLCRGARFSIVDFDDQYEKKLLIIQHSHMVAIFFFIDTAVTTDADILASPFRPEKTLTR